MAGMAGMAGDSLLGQLRGQCSMDGAQGMTWQVRPVTMRPARAVPSEIAMKALRMPMPKRKAATAAVHAPVDGNGTATKRTRPRGPYFWTRPLLARVRAKNHSLALRTD